VGQIRHLARRSGAISPCETEWGQIAEPAPLNAAPVLLQGAAQCAPPHPSPPAAYRHAHLRAHTHSIQNPRGVYTQSKTGETNRIYVYVCVRISACASRMYANRNVVGLQINTYVILVDVRIIVVCACMCINVGVRTEVLMHTACMERCMHYRQTSCCMRHCNMHRHTHTTKPHTSTFWGEGSRTARTSTHRS